MPETLNIYTPKLMKELKVTKILKSLGDIIQKGDVLFEAEDNDYMFELRSDKIGVLSRITVFQGDTISSEQLVANLMSIHGFNDCSERDISTCNHANTDEIEQIENPQVFVDAQCTIPEDGLSEKEIEQIVSHHNLKKIYDRLMKIARQKKYFHKEDVSNQDAETFNSVFIFNEIENLFKERISMKSSTVRDMLSVFNASHDKQQELDLSFVYEINLTALIKTTELFKEKFIKNFGDAPKIEPFVVKALNAVISEDSAFTKDTLNVIIYADNDKVYKNYLTDIKSKNIYEIQNEIYKESVINRTDKDVLTIIFNHRSQVAFCNQENVVIVNSINQESNMVFVTHMLNSFNVTEVKNEFLKYLENPGWIFFIL